MILQYRNYAHEDNECAITPLEQIPYFGERGRRLGITKKFQITGTLFGDTQAALKTEILALEAAYAVDGGDLKLAHNDGTVSAHVILDRDTLGGIRVTSGPNYPKGDGAEYAAGNGRSYSITVEADVPQDNENLLNWNQSISGKGVAGAEKWLYVAVLNGFWQRQTVNQRTPVIVVQRGSATGQFRHPNPPPPIWPVFEHQELREINLDDPVRKGADLTTYKIAWSYSFESIVPLRGSSRVP